MRGGGGGSSNGATVLRGMAGNEKATLRWMRVDNDSAWLRRWRQGCRREKLGYLSLGRGRDRPSET